VKAPVWWERVAGDGAARSGVLYTPHGWVPTPAFMPVGTRGSVRAIGPGDLRAAGADIVLANAFHLMLRPGDGIVAGLGGLHRFMGWDGPILTDSGGFQVFSLGPKVDETGARFRSPYDGSWHHLTPEVAIGVQERLGSDIAMVLDVCLALPASPPDVIGAMERTLRWSERALAAHRRPDQALFGIVQGGTDPALRRASARATVDLDVPGFGIGGLSVGETPEERRFALEVTVGELPLDKVRYVMGLGDPVGVLEAVALGADLFDCVWPTRLARHGKILTPDGDYHLKAARFATDPGPLHSECGCSTCRVHSRAYLRHLHMTGELLAHSLLTVHNLHYTMELMAATRRAIEERRFEEHRVALVARRLSPHPPAE
jgi:queuine tRNA-ribosyltransferase